jgi:hypothetical protein
MGSTTLEPKKGINYFSSQLPIEIRLLIYGQLLFPERTIKISPNAHHDVLGALSQVCSKLRNGITAEYTHRVFVHSWVFGWIRPESTTFQISIPISSHEWYHVSVIEGYKGGQPTYLKTFTPDHPWYYILAFEMWQLSADEAQSTTPDTKITWNKNKKLQMSIPSPFQYKQRVLALGLHCKFGHLHSIKVQRGMSTRRMMGASWGSIGWETRRAGF